MAEGYLIVGSAGCWDGARLSSGGRCYRLMATKLPFRLMAVSFHVCHGCHCEDQTEHCAPVTFGQFYSINVIKFLIPGFYI